MLIFPATFNLLIPQTRNFISPILSVSSMMSLPYACCARLYLNCIQLWTGFKKSSFYFPGLHYTFFILLKMSNARFHILWPLGDVKMEFFCIVIYIWLYEV